MFQANRSFGIRPANSLAADSGIETRDSGPEIVDSHGELVGLTGRPGAAGRQPCAL